MIDELPNELLLIILNCCDRNSLYNLINSNKNLLNISKETELYNIFLQYKRIDRWTIMYSIRDRNYELIKKTLKYCPWDIYISMYASKLGLLDIIKYIINCCNYISNK